MLTRFRHKRNIKCSRVQKFEMPPLFAKFLTQTLLSIIHAIVTFYSLTPITNLLLCHVFCSLTPITNLLLCRVFCSLTPITNSCLAFCGFVLIIVIVLHSRCNFLQDTLKLPRNNLDWLNSSGTFALQQDAGKVELSAVMSFSNREVVVFFNVFVQAFNHSVHITLRNEFVHSIWTRLSGQH